MRYDKINYSLVIEIKDALVEFILTRTSTSTSACYGIATICNFSSNSWIYSANISITGIVSSSAGFKSLNATLDRIRITTVGSSDTFDAGSVNIMYE